MKGIYILIIKLNKDSEIKIGSLKNLDFKKGIYAYIGSSQNNLEKRIERHLRKNKKIHWHIDYLLKNKNAKIINVSYKVADKSEECKTAKKLIKNNIPITGFGCSDCKCNSHLFRIKNKGLNEPI